jgi:deoxyribodipyrimidine photo-lyase
MTSDASRMRRIVVLFTRDLRVHDNPVLDLACRSAREVLPLFVIDPSLRSAAPNRARFLLECLADLRHRLRERGGNLLVRTGDPVTETLELARDCDADGVVMAADVSRYAANRGDRLAAACAEHRLALRTVDAVTIVPPRALTPPGGDHYRVFTPYWRAWSTSQWRPVVPAVRRLATPSGLCAGRTPGLATLAYGCAAASLPAGGETEARRRMRRWLDGGLAAYPDRHDDLAGDATSRLSADLHFGTLSPLELARAVRDRPGGDAYVRQLCWRDFHAQVTAAFPDIARRDYRPRSLDWRDDPDALDAWRSGHTGIPIVDAGMRQLAAEGFMHNRARMLVASVLTRQLRLHWTTGAAHFFDLLVDGDVANNAGNWQWTAGTGNDTRPHRRFNPTRQAHRFDPDGDYVRRYVPELASIPDARVHEPWRLPHVHYPAPIVSPAGDVADRRG